MEMDGVHPDLSTTMITDSRGKHYANRTLGVEYLKSVYPSFKKRYDWFRRTQWGDLESYDRKSRSKEAYRWRGRSGYHTLTSGLDDYPRSPAPHPGELHLDLICWVGFMAKSLEKFSNVIGNEADAKRFGKELKDVLASLEDLHWDQSANAFTDLTVNDAGMLLDF